MFTHCICRVAFSWQTCWYCTAVNVLQGLYLRCYPSGEYSVLFNNTAKGKVWSLARLYVMSEVVYLEHLDVSGTVSECLWRKRHSCSSLVMQMWHDSTQSNFSCTHVTCRKVSCSLHETQLNTCTEYKYAVRRLHRRQNHLRREVLAKALCSDSSRDFWTEVKRFEGRSTRGTSGVIDGTSGSASIADLWAGKFEALLNTKNPEGRERLLGQISTALNPSILGNLCVTDVQVMTAVRKLKRAKSDGRQLLSDNVINAPSSFFLALARLFTAILRHGHTPICMRDAILQPIPKGGGKDQSCSANYRGIALASSLSKVLEWCIILSNPSVFSSSDLQFGFKRGVSTSMCRQFLKSVVHHYNHGGSPVYCCLLDASKAFDLVDHFLSWLLGTCSLQSFVVWFFGIRISALLFVGMALTLLHSLPLMGYDRVVCFLLYSIWMICLFAWLTLGLVAVWMSSSVGLFVMQMTWPYWLHVLLHSEQCCGVVRNTVVSMVSWYQVQSR